MDKALRIPLRRRWLAASVIALALAGCGSGAAHSSRTISPSESAALATARAAAGDYVSTCIPKDAAHQVLLGKSLLGKDGRQKFAACLAIPKGNRPAFEAALLTAVEKVKWSDKAQRHDFFAVTLPGIADRYHVSPQASIPGFPATVTASPSAS